MGREGVGQRGAYQGQWAERIGGKGSAGGLT